MANNLIKEFHKPATQMSILGNHKWSIPRLFELSKDLEVMDIPLKHLTISYKYENVTLREMVGHIKAVNEADLSFPIILDEEGDVMDGRHRIMKAILNGHETIKAVRFEDNPNPCQVGDD